MTSLREFLHDDQGQDLVEYTLLLVFVAIAGAAVFIGVGGSVSSVWARINNLLAGGDGAGT